VLAAGSGENMAKFMTANICLAGAPLVISMEHAAALAPLAPPQQTLSAMMNRLLPPLVRFARRTSWLAAASGALFAATATKPVPPPAKPPHLPMRAAPGAEVVRLPENAVKGGVMTKLKDGRVMLVYAWKDVFEPVGTSALRALYSNDEGKTWGGARNLLQDPGYNPGRPTLLRVRDGRLWLIYYGFVRSVKENGGKSDLWITSSEDDGQNWQPPRRLFEGYTAGQRHAIQARDGLLAVAVSSDEGRTWSPPATIAQTTYACYPHLLERAPGELLLTTGLLKAADYSGDVVVFRFSAQDIFR